MTFPSCRTGRSRDAVDSNPDIIQVSDGKQLSETWPEDVRPQPWTEGIWEGRGLRNLTVELLFPGLVVPGRAGYGSEDDHGPDRDEPGHDAEDRADRPVGLAVGDDR